MSANDELQELLLSAMASKTPGKAKENSAQDLASLLSSVDMTTPAKPARERAIGLSRANESSNPVFDAANLPIPPHQQGAKKVAPSINANEANDFITLKYGMEISLRGRFGKYLTAIRTDNNDKDQENWKRPNNNSVYYQLGVVGQGVGDAHDSLVLVNAEQKDYVGPVLYGSVVAIKCPAALERLLGIARDTSKLGFWRGLVGLGPGEQWLLLKASSNSRYLEEPNSRGMVAQLSDLILLQAVGSKGPTDSLISTRSISSIQSNNFNFADHLLSIHESADGQHPRLLHKDRIGLGLEVWQVELFSSQPSPSWFNRPYLRCDAILTQGF